MPRVRLFRRIRTPVLISIHPLQTHAGKYRRRRFLARYRLSGFGGAFGYVFSMWDHAEMFEIYAGASLIYAIELRDVMPAVFEMRPNCAIVPILPYRQLRGVDQPDTWGDGESGNLPLRRYIWPIDSEYNISICAGRVCIIRNNTDLPSRFPSIPIHFRKR